MSPHSGEGPPERTALVVLGMHRSGTSALATLLHRTGAALPRTVMPPAPDNPTGFSESTVLVELADEMLAELGMSWESPGRVPEEWFRSPDADGWADRYSEALRAEFPDTGARHLVLKDPRLCRLVPLVSDACARADLVSRFAISLRHPVDVAESLRVRNDWSLERGLVSWMTHYLPAEKATRGAIRTFVSYDALLEDWRSVLARLAGALETPVELEGTTPEELDGALDASLRHHAHGSGTSPSSSKFEPWIGRCYRALLDLEAGRLEATSELDRVDRTVRKLEERFLPIASDLERTAGEERREREAVQANLAHAEHVISDLESKVADRETRADALRRTVAELEEARRLALGEARRLAREIEETRNELEGRLVRAEADISYLQEQVADRAAVQAHLRYAEDRIRDLEADLDRLRQSRSMRITRPLRRLSARAGAARATLRRTLGGAARKVFHATPLPEGVRRVIRDAWGRRRERRRSARDATIREDERDRTRSAVLPGSVDEKDPREAFRSETRRELEAFLASGRTLRLPEPTEPPTLSVLLVLYEQADLTFACLRALAASRFTDFEVVIVDNASTDRTREMLERIGPCRVVLNDENLHFLRGANLAAEHARGRYLLFLNNDTRIAPDALGRAFAVFGDEERVGAVGGRLILPDGSLQEAGSIVWSDGSCLGYGRGGDPTDARWMFRRDVDYCSGAFLMTPRELFSDLGGFDERFAPAYYEDTDYCMRIRAAGRRVLYEPGVVVAHYEFGSSNPDEGATLQRRNQERFVEKHRKLLAEHREPGPDNVLRARSARHRAPKVLCVDDRFPHRALGSGFPRANDLIHRMVELGCELTVYATDQPEEPWDEVYSDIPSTVECLRGDRGDGLKAVLRERRGHADVILVSRPHNMEAFDRILTDSPGVFGRQRVVYDAEALFSLREIGRRELAGAPLPRDERRNLVRDEVSLARRADAIITVTGREARYFRGCPGEVAVIGHALSAESGPAGYDEREGFLFLGAFHADPESPNADSMRWFVREVWPRIRSEAGMEDARVEIVGKEPPRAVLALGRTPGIEVVGTVPDTRPHYDRARICVVPTRFAAGIPYKAHEAAAHGVPMVATRLVARQLGWRHERDLMRADAGDPEAFARHCVRLYTDPELWTRLRKSALQRLGEDCSPKRIESNLLRALGFGRAALAGARPWRTAADRESERSAAAEGRAEASGAR